MVSRLVRRAGSGIKTGFAVVGFAAAVGLYSEYKKLFPKDEDDDSKKKNKVLLVPFHRMQLLERKDQTFRGSLTRMDPDDDTKTFPIEIRELVDVLHHAASDPNITAVYGIFGHGGMGLSQAGWAQLEEIRNALQVVKESHRRHHEPNFTYEEQVIPRVQSKPLYAYADSMMSLVDPSNKEYYLASIFTHIHLQEKGELNLFGMLSQQFFVRDFLEKYGFQLHVFKQGVYKNAPNIFTHNTFNKFHKENVENIHNSIHEDVCLDISISRSKALLTGWLTKKHTSGGGDSTLELWKKIHGVGSFPSESAWKAGLVDYLPRCDPLGDLVESNEGYDENSETHEKKDEVTKKWNAQETDFKRFPSDGIVKLEDYAKIISKKKNAAERLQRWQDLAEKSPMLGQLFSSIGLTDEEGTKKKERIALLHVDGTIGDEAARKLASSIRKIRKDDKTKCVVVRVSSPGGSIVACESILQELKRLDVPVVVSFGNISASGGYYISSAADRIFSSKKTITGSVGVFGIRVDMTGFAKQYGINIEHIPSGDLSAQNSPFTPMTKKMKENLAVQIDRHYDQFKKVVAEGRNLSETEVEAIAQGRVWTGDQAKSNGLIDELGGLDRAIAYARRSYTETGEEADIVVWPKKKTLLERLAEAKEKSGTAEALAGIILEWAIGTQAPSELSIVDVSTGVPGIVNWMLQSPTGVPGTLSGVVMAADENSAIRCLLENAQQPATKARSSLLPDSFWQ